MSTTANPLIIRDLIEEHAGVPREVVLQAIRDLTAELSEADTEALLYDWEGIWARRDQLVPPGGWLFWLNMAGRGWGKTRVGAETIRKWGTEEMPGSRLFIAARTMDDAKKTCVEGESGLLACLPSRFQPPFGGHWNRSAGELWIGPARESATYVKLFTSEKPDAGRGYQSHGGWADELSSWMKAGELWDQLLLGLRLPWPKRLARAVVTTTPKPVPVLRELLANPDTIVTKGTTYDNLQNLSPAFRSIIKKFEGTRVGRQELNAELLDDTPGALWNRKLLEDLRVKFPPLRLSTSGEEEFDFLRIVVAIDPSTTSGEKSDEAGIMVGGVAPDRHRYLLEDGSLRGAPHQWATEAVRLYRHYKADCIVAEANNGGEMITAVVRAVDPSVRSRLVYASRGKHIRAEPIATAYETGEIHHVGAFELLEDELCTWTPEAPKSPNRLDALVWLMTELEGRRLVL